MGQGGIEQVPMTKKTVRRSAVLRIQYLLMEHAMLNEEILYAMSQWDIWGMGHLGHGTSGDDLPWGRYNECFH